MFALTSIWQVGADLLFNNDTTSNALNLIINVIFVIFLGAFVWETINAFVEHLMAKADAQNPIGFVRSSLSCVR